MGWLQKLLRRRASEPTQGLVIEDAPNVERPSTAAVATPEADQLYTRLGGVSAIQGVIDDFLVNVSGDTRINHFFTDVNIPRLNTLLVQFVARATGGPEQYTGRYLRSAHVTRKITMTDFNALVDDLAKSLDKFKVPDREKNELLGLLAPLNKDVVSA